MYLQRKPFINITLWCCLPVFLATLAYFVTKASWVAGRATPRLEYPREVDLGQREFGEIAVGRFAISNRGSAPLVIDNISTSCSCAGMEREIDGKFYHVDELHIPPGEEENLIVRVAVRSERVGAPMATVISFRTNDPGQPQGRMKVIVPNVTGGVFTSPKSMIFGTVPVGTRLRRLIDICDTARDPRSVQRIIAQGSDRIRVRLLPCEDVSKSRGPDGTSAVIARMEVEIDTTGSGEIHGEVQIQVSGPARKLDSFEIAGRVLAPIEIRPSSLILPRQTTNGPIFEAKAMVSNSGDAPLSLTIGSSPKGLRAEILPAESPKHRIVRVVWNPKELPVVPTGQRHVLRLHATAGEIESTLELPVLLQPTDD